MAAVKGQRRDTFDDPRRREWFIFDGKPHSARPDILTQLRQDLRAGAFQGLENYPSVKPLVRLPAYLTERDVPKLWSRP